MPSVDPRARELDSTAGAILYNIVMNDGDTGRPVLESSSDATDARMAFRWTKSKGAMIIHLALWHPTLAFDHERANPVVRTVVPVG